MLKKLLYTLAIVIATSFHSLPVSAAISSSANNFYIKNFTADYYLSRDEDGTSRMRVLEEITAVFPSSDQNHGITRVIPFTNNDGKNLTMPSDNTIYINVERNGAEEPVSQVEVGDGYFVVYIGNADSYVHGEQTYTLEYEFTNLILDFQNGQELYWDANGNDWQQRFDQVTARVHLEDNLAESLNGETACYVGRYYTGGEAAQKRCKTTKTSDGIEFSAKALLSGETLTFDVGFKNDTFAPAPQHYSYRLVITIIIAIAGAIAMFVLIILTLRSVKSKVDYEKGLFVKPEYTPPHDFTVAEMAANYIGKGANGNSKVATLLELAVNHKIELIKTETTGVFGKKKDQWKIHLLSTELTTWQVVVLKILVGSNAALHVGQKITVEKHSANNQLVRLAEKFTKYVEQSLENKGLSEKKSQKKTKNLPSILAVFASIWLFGWIMAMMFVFDDTPSYITMLGGTPLIITTAIIVAATFLSGLIVSVKTSKYHDRTEKGLEYSKYLEGLRLYISMAEAERLEFTQSIKGVDTSHNGIVKLYEKLLPYAAIFQLEKSWLAEMGKYYEFDDVAAPSWYVGVGAFSAHEFVSAMNAVSASASTSIVHSTTSNSSSGSSGFGGGGFAGGGGGGGGGGGW